MAIPRKSAGLANSATSSALLTPKPAQLPLAAYLAASELRVAINHGANSSHVLFSGTRAQLDGEGAVPAGTEWPPGRDTVAWEKGPLQFYLWRSRPKGMKGPISAWLALDHWSLHMQLLTRHAQSLTVDKWFSAMRAELLQKSDTAKEAACARQKLHACAALQDLGFQSFLALLPGLAARKPRRGRPPATGQGSRA